VAQGADELVTCEAQQQRRPKEGGPPDGGQRQIEQAAADNQCRAGDLEIGDLDGHRASEGDEHHRKGQADPPAPDRKGENWQEQQRDHGGEFSLERGLLDDAWHTCQGARIEHAPLEIGAAGVGIQHREAVAYGLDEEQSGDSGLNRTEKVPSELRHG